MEHSPPNANTKRKSSPHHPTIFRYHKLSRNATSPEAIFWHDLIDCFPGIIDWVLYELDTERKRRQVLLIFKSLQRYVEQFGKDDGSYDGAGRDSGCCKKDTRGGRGRLALRIQKHHRAPLLFKLLESEDLMADGPATPGKGNQLRYHPGYTHRTHRTCTEHIHRALTTHTLRTLAAPATSSS